MSGNISPKELMKEFAVKGLYYMAPYGRNKKDKRRCRRCLEIYTKDLDFDRDVRGHNANLVVIMMNPGGSMPMDGSNLLDEKEGYNDDWHDAKPDTTQYQIMRLAVRTKEIWEIKHIRVLNLFDLCEAKSKEAAEGIEESSSIFDDGREDELKEYLGKKSTPILLAWGQNSKIKDLAKKAKEFLDKNGYTNILGLQEPFYRHPLPRGKQQEWVDEMVNQVSKENRLKK